MERKPLIIDITLKDGSILKECAIFPEEVKNGDEPFTTVQEINDAFQKILWGKKFVSFQSQVLNGYVHVNNVLEYKIL